MENRPTILNPPGLELPAGAREHKRRLTQAAASELAGFEGRVIGSRASTVVPR
jgi:hypothetical protein